MMKKVDVFLLLAVLSSSVLVLGEKNDVGDDEKDIKNGDFVPTHEWQPLRKDQAIPRGLHVRLNLETGEREAKLLDPNEHESDNSKSSLSQISESSASNDKFSWEEIKDALHKMEDDGISLGVNPEDIDRVKKKFRSYSELKKELGEVKLDVKTELEVMNQLLEDYQDILSRKDDELSRKDDESNYKELIESEEALLNHLENLVHQTDNANHFMKSNGFKQVVFQSLNSTSWRVRYEATKVFGSAVQSNPKVQIGALENGAIPVFLRTLALDSHPKVKSGALYGISCLIRSFPLAQGQFLEKGGLQALLKQFDSDTSEQLKLQIRSLKLINDLINEIQDSESEKEDMTNKSLYEQELAREKEKQQNSLRLKERLVEQGWCEALLLVLSRHPDDVELVELIANSMINMAKPCSPAFSKRSTFLLEMAEKYKDLIGREEHDYMWIHALFTKLSQLMDRKRDEL